MKGQIKIFLTGFMGSGKSTLGKKLSQISRRNFIDLDKYIEKKSAKSISQIFNELGEDEFRRLESICLAEVLQIKGNSIVSLGGGTICFFDNLKKIKRSGILVYLQLPPKALSERIRKSRVSRPLLQHLQPEELLLKIEEKLEERKIFYEQAHLTVNGINLTAQLLQHNIIEYLEKNNL